jgi:gamma-glutamylcyclotransferase (GGCT)/AIG2-like uncharacterized protein YtfP
VPGTWELATVRGRLLQKGWGAEAGLPGIVLDEDGPEVHGMLFSSAMLSEHWKRLDHFESDGYERVLTSARLQGGGTAMAYIYVLRGMLAASDTITSA